jgi:hypothetical protein
MRKDKKTVLDEVWTEDHVKSFLKVKSHDDSAEDFHMLLKAYQSMRADDLNCLCRSSARRPGPECHRQGWAQMLESSLHRHEVEYADILKAAGRLVWIDSSPFSVRVNSGSLCHPAVPAEPHPFHGHRLRPRPFRLFPYSHSKAFRQILYRPL